MAARNIKAVVAYDGTAFSGWQTQADARTVQSEFEKALRRVHRHRVQLHAAGRTDSGVHADGQVVNFFTDNDSIPERRFADALNANLPADVRVMSTVEVHEGFHARHDAKARIYRYQIYPRPVVPPTLRRYCHSVATRPDWRRLNAMAGFLVGTHDFTTFTATADKNLSKVREVFSAGFVPDGCFLRFFIAGSGFLWRMVRSIVGTLLALDARRVDPVEFRRLLEARDRSGAAETAPPCGLFLHRVVYD